MSNLTCIVCEAAVGLISAEANLTNATVAVISKAVTTLCAVIGGAVVSGECKFIVGSIDKIMSWLDAGLTHAQVCERLHLC